MLCRMRPMWSFPQKRKKEQGRGRTSERPHPTPSCKSSLEAWLISGTSMLPEGPAVWAEAPPTGETTPQREELTTQLTSPNTAHTCTIPHIHKHTLNFKHIVEWMSWPDTNAGCGPWSGSPQAEYSGEDAVATTRAGNYFFPLLFLH